MTVIKCKINTIKLLSAKTVIYANMYTHIYAYVCILYIHVCYLNCHTAGQQHRNTKLLPTKARNLFRFCLNVYATNSVAVGVVRARYIDI